ncbi:hypothetical protein TNCV_2853091 [Trichonephila clavipes]|uniref:Uncharacterized protein n=1 Tax=Trichonephila clavipes TaxID=2585209 RepID=A0A8X6V0U7_TRICX|nr:hypothetical protein TNCV_2853091 [Trichonephila clavipes]
MSGGRPVRRALRHGSGHLDGFFAVKNLSGERVFLLVVGKYYQPLDKCVTLTSQWIAAGRNLPSYRVV